MSLDRNTLDQLERMLGLPAGSIKQMSQEEALGIWGIMPVVEKDDAARVFLSWLDQSSRDIARKPPTEEERAPALWDVVNKAFAWLDIQPEPVRQVTLDAVRRLLYTGEAEGFCVPANEATAGSLEAILTVIDQAAQTAEERQRR